MVAQTYPDSAPFLPEAWVLNASNKIVEESLLISPGLAPVSRDSDQTIVFHDCRSVVVNMHQTHWSYAPHDSSLSPLLHVMRTPLDQQVGS